MRGVAAAADGWWRAPAPPERLAVLRVLIGGYALVFLLVRMPELLRLSQFRDEQFAPVGVANALPEPLPEWLLRLLVAATIVAAVPFVLGLRFRVTGPLFAVLLLCLLTYRNSFAQIFHTENLLVFHVIILAAAPAAVALAVDSSREEHGRRAEADAFGWPVRLMCLVTVATYVIAGVAKLQNAGLEWVTDDVLRNYVAYDNLRKVELGDWHSPLGAALVAHAWIFKPLAAMTLAVELLAPLALLGRRARWAWAATAWTFHVGVLATMAILFPYQLTGIAFASFFAVERFLPSRWRMPSVDHRRAEPA